MRDAAGKTRETVIPLRAYDHAMATDMALAYALQVLKADDFELRVVGA
jgi:hypothetical protein